MDIVGEIILYQWKMYLVGIGESVSLYCGVVVLYNLIIVLWFFNKSFCFNDSFCIIKMYIEEWLMECEISSDLNVNFIEDINFGIFICFLEIY